MFEPMQRGKGRISDNTCKQFAGLGKGVSNDNLTITPKLAKSKSTPTATLHNGRAGVERWNLGGLHGRCALHNMYEWVACWLCHLALVSVVPGSQP